MMGKKYSGWALWIMLTLILCSEGNAQVWVRKVAGTGLGNPLTTNPLDNNILYAAAGSNQIYISRNRGYTWQNFGAPISGGGVIKSIAVSPLDTLDILIGVEISGSPDKILKSTNAGTTWVATWSGTFNYFGKPVEFKPQHPDTVYTMSNDTIWRSVDFGSTWTIVSVVSGLFNSWCDAQIRPDSANILYVGDNASGIWKSTDHAVTWKRVYPAPSLPPNTGEIPSIAIDPFHPQVAYAAKYSGGGGMLKTTNGGESWQSITTPIGFGNSWWVTTSTVSPGYVYFGTYGASPSGPFFSRDSGASWVRIATADTGQLSFNALNYGMLVTDTLTVLTLQANGLWKLKFDERISFVNDFSGGYLRAGSVHTIEWTDSNIAKVRIDLSTDDGATWNEISTLDGGIGMYDWTIPVLTSFQCRLRVANYYSGVVFDTSDSPFTIYETPLTITAPDGGEQWYVGSTREITWVCSIPVSTSLELTTDSGATWSALGTNLPGVFSFTWIVPDMATSSLCRIRIRDLNDSVNVDESDSLFSIISMNEFTTMIDIRDAGGERDTLYFGSSAGATDGIDTALSEADLSPKPVPGTFDARWNITASNGSKKDYRDTLGEGNTENRFIVEAQPGPSGYPVTLSWDKATLNSGTYIIRDTATHGGGVFRDMRKLDSLQIINNPDESALEIIQCRTNFLSFNSSGGWKLMSVPFLTGDLLKSSIMPNSYSSAFGYGNGYVQADSLEYGKGYWVKLSQVTFSGCDRMIDTIDVQESWNIIGSLGAPVSVASVTSIPENLIESNFWGFSGGYFPANNLEPGQGYWVKTNGAGKIILQAGVTNKMVSVPEKEEGLFNTLQISDDVGNNQSLLFKTGETGVIQYKYELPPLPPSHSFDVRFSTNHQALIVPKMMENDMDFPILLQTPSFKNIFSWNVEFDKNFSYILKRKKGHSIVGETQLAGSGSIRFDNVKGMEFVLSIAQTHRQEEPLTFSLSPNYPNPFNPLTKVNYTLPHDAFMTLRIVNTLGQEVAMLVNGIQKSGSHEVEWNGVNDRGLALSSGVYYMMMNVNQGESHSSVIFSAVRALILIK